MLNEHMQLIIRREKNHEFRRYRLPDTVARIWFYLSAPLSHIAYVCEVLPVRGRRPGEQPLPEDGVGNKEFNERHEDWEKYNYAYPVQSVYKVATPISLRELKENYGLKGAPRSAVYASDTLLRAVDWRTQECLWSSKVAPNPTVQGESRKNSTDRKRRRVDCEASPTSGHERNRQVSHWSLACSPGALTLFYSQRT